MKSQTFGLLVAIGCLTRLSSALYHAAVMSNKTYEAKVSFFYDDAGVPQVSREGSGFTTLRSPYTYHVHKLPIVNEDCATAGPHFNPFNVLYGNFVYPVSKNLPTYETGDLSGKFGTLKPAPQSYSQTFADPSLELTGTLVNIRGRSVVLHNAARTMVACGNIVDSATEDGDPLFYADLAYSTLTMRVSFFAAANGTAMVQVEANGIPFDGNPYSYHVHQNPVDETGDCSTTGSHYNPFSIVYGTVSYGTTNQYDTFEIGDLSGKFGTLVGSVGGVIPFASFVDPLLRLNGQLVNIISRSVVVHGSGSVWSCGNIMESPVGSGVYTALVNGTVFLNVTFYENSSGQVVVERQGSKFTTAGFVYNWHIHVNRITGACSTAGAHYSPYGVVLGTPVTKPVAGRYLTYEVGDLSGKFGKISAGYIAPTTYIDSSLRLQSSLVNIVAGRSVVIHSNSGGRVACANILPYTVDGASVPTQYSAIIVNNGTINANFTFYDISGLGSELGNVTVSVTASGLLADQSPYSYHIHVNPVTTDCASTAGHYNPFGIVYGNFTYPVSGRPETYEVGDLSGRFGAIIGTPSSVVTKEQYAYPLAVFTQDAATDLTGRSVVIHDKGGARIACANILTYDDDETSDASPKTIVALMVILLGALVF
eukprot:Partr_v1_DN27362_c0_g1_i2_m46654 putative superoxide dismutase